MYCKQMNNICTFIIVCLMCIASQTGTYAQVYPLSKKIDIHCTQITIEKAFAEISSKAQVYFSYNPDIIPLDSVISIHANQKEVQIILHQIFGTRYTYKTTGNYIIIQKQKTSKQVATAKQQKPVQIKGTVKEATSGTGISNTSVYSINGKQQTLTDAQGNFELTMNAHDDIAIAIQNQNYVDTVMVFNQQTDSTLTISLTTKAIQDTNILVIGKQLSKQAIEQVGIISKLLTKEIQTHASNIDFFTERPFQISLVPYVGTNHSLSGTITNIVSLNAIAGYSYGVSGCEIGGILNMNRTHVKGLQISGFGNITGGYVRGAQIAGFFNHTNGTSKGIQIAGFSNITKDSVQGIEIAGFSNISKKKKSGIQMSGFANITEQLSGIQAAGFTNISHVHVHGIQTSGFANICGDSVEGMQIAGFTNISKKSIRGIQIAGFFNKAQQVDGVQIGIINIADTVSGVSIGLLNFVKHGYHSVSLQINETGGISALSQFGTHRLYTTIGLTTFYPTQTYMTGLEYGLGTIFRHKKRIQLQIDATVTNIAQDIRKQANHIQLYTASSSLSLGMGNHLRFFGGPSYKALMYNKSEIDTSPLPQSQIPLYSQSYTTNDISIDTWIGLQVGLQYTW